MFFRGPHASSWRPFDPKVLSGRGLQAAGSFPVFGQRAWRTRELVVELQALRRCSSAEAESEVLDMPWHRTHDCPERPTPSTSPDSPHHAGVVDVAEPAREDPNP